MGHQLGDVPSEKRNDSLLVHFRALSVKRLDLLLVIHSKAWRGRGSVPMISRPKKELSARGCQGKDKAIMMLHNGSASA